MDDIGDILIHSVGLVVGDPECGTSHGAMGAWGGIVLVVDCVGKDRYGMFFVYFLIPQIPTEIIKEI